MKRKKPYRPFAALLVILGCASAVRAQEAPHLARPLRVYFDCPNVDCDERFLIEEVPWVDFVRDRGVADVHVLVTEQETGGGGAELTLRFIGRDRFDGREQSLTHVVRADATDDDERRALARTTRLGLAPFALATSAASRLDVAWSGADVETPTAAAADPWHRWVFELGVDTWFEGEDRYSALELHGWASANRVTEDWRVALSMDANDDRNTFEIDDTTTVDSRRESYSGNVLVARSISPHWSVGGWGGGSRSTHANYDVSLRLGPAVEYSVFPYGESTSRLFTILYVIGPRYFDYAERTIFGRLHEATLHHFLALNYDATQPWGAIDVLLDLTHILAPLDGSDGWGEPQYSASLHGGLEARLVRGLSLRLDGSAALVRNQIHLAGGGLTDEEILTRQRELATDYRYWASIGLSYQFGSIFSPVVNRRLDYLD